jgi:SAM-dependent methyltransferase
MVLNSKPRSSGNSWALNNPDGVGFSNQEMRNSRTQGLHLKSTIACLFRYFPIDKLRETTIIDYGCGSGRLSAPLAPYVKSIVLADVSHEFLDLAKRNLREHHNVEFVHLNPLDPNLPFNKSKFTHTISYAALGGGMPKDLLEKALIEINRVSDTFALEVAPTPDRQLTDLAGGGWLSLMKRYQLEKKTLGHPAKVLDLEELLVKLNNSSSRVILENCAPEPKYRGVMPYFFKLEEESSNFMVAFGQHHYLKAQSFSHADYPGHLLPSPWLYVLRVLSRVINIKIRNSPRSVSR